MSKFTSIGKKALFAILIVSTLVTTVFTFISFTMDYHNEMDLLEANLSLVEDTSGEPLAMAIWDFNEVQVKHLLDGIIKINDFLSVEVWSTDKSKKLYETKKIEPDQYKKRSMINHEFKLSFMRDQKEEVVGILKVTVTKAGIFNRLFKKALIFFLLQGLKTACVSFLILFIFRKLIINHIKKIHAHLKELTENKFHLAKTLQLNRSNNVNDEFTHLTQIINDMANIISEHQIQLTQKLEETKKNLHEQKERSVQNAKMASLGEMAGGISHEINNPLTIVTGKLSILKRKNKESVVSQEEWSESLDLLLKTSDRIAKIIRGLKAFARDGAKDPLVDCSFNQILTDSLFICEEKIKRLGIILHIEEFGNIQIKARPVEISQVIVNLISNSIDALEHQDEKWIKIAAVYNESLLELVITDSGHGIPDAIAAKIMEPFFTTKEVNKGTGLGLSISKGIIEAHGGRIFIDQQCPNTRFIIQIPKFRLENIS